jgi:spore coat protein CotH
MERAAKKIEAAQGWQVENNIWSEIDEHGEAINKPVKSNEKIHQKIKDKEVRTGEQSAVRKAQADLKNMDVRTWEELHNFMREHGMEYQKKGSGAVINVGDAIIKASSGKRCWTR